MIQYNPKDWFGLIFKFHKSDTFRKLIWVMLSLAVYSALAIFIEREVLMVEEGWTTSIHSLLGFVISLLLVFRTNTAYDRWWEGRKQWGELVNVSRNFTLKVKAFIPESDIATKTLLYDATTAYASVLKEHLRGDTPENIKSRLSKSLPLGHGNHIPNALANAMHTALLEAFNRHATSQAVCLAMLNDVNAFTNICGACERIRKTPIPYTYNIFIKKFIFIYIVTMPIAFIGDFGYWSILVTVFTFYTLASLELIAEEIEDPFGTDTDDLPTDDLAATIAANVEEISIPSR